MKNEIIKLKVKVIAISLKGNKVGRLGDVVKHTDLANPDYQKLVKDGYLEYVDALQFKENNDGQVDNSLGSKTIKQLLKIAKEKGIEVDKNSKKDIIVSTIIAALDVQDSEDVKGEKEKGSEEEE